VCNLESKEDYIHTYSIATKNLTSGATYDSTVLLIRAHNAAHTQIMLYSKHKFQGLGLSLKGDHYNEVEEDKLLHSGTGLCLEKPPNSIRLNYYLIL